MPVKDLLCYDERKPFTIPDVVVPIDNPEGDRSQKHDKVALYELSGKQATVVVDDAQARSFQPALETSRAAAESPVAQHDVLRLPASFREKLLQYFRYPGAREVSFR